MREDMSFCAPNGVRLDRTDVDLLRTLHASARIANQDLAKVVKLSASACLLRVRRLETSGAITRYVTEIDESLTSAWSILWLEVQLRKEGRSNRPVFEQAIRSESEIVEAHELTGGADYLLKAALPTIAEWSRLCAKIDPDSSIIRRVHILGGVRTVKPRSPHPLMLVAGVSP